MNFRHASMPPENHAKTCACVCDQLNVQSMWIYIYIAVMQQLCICCKSYAIDNTACILQTGRPTRLLRLSIYIQTGHAYPNGYHDCN